MPATHFSSLKVLRSSRRRVRIGIFGKCSQIESRMYLKEMVKEHLTQGKTSFEFRFAPGCEFDPHLSGAIITLGKHICQMGGQIRLSMGEDLFEQFFAMRMDSLFPITTRAPF